MLAARAAAVANPVEAARVAAATQSAAASSCTLGNGKQQQQQQQVHASTMQGLVCHSGECHWQLSRRLGVTGGSRAPLLDWV